jgi:hypothetical protein
MTTEPAGLSTPLMVAIACNVIAVPSTVAGAVNERDAPDPLNVTVGPAVCDHAHALTVPVMLAVTVTTSWLLTDLAGPRSGGDVAAGMPVIATMMPPELAALGLIVAVRVPVAPAADSTCEPTQIVLVALVPLSADTVPTVVMLPGPVNADGVPVTFALLIAYPTSSVSAALVVTCGRTTDDVPVYAASDPYESWTADRFAPNTRNITPAMRCVPVLIDHE